MTTFIVIVFVLLLIGSIIYFTQKADNFPTITSKTDYQLTKTESDGLKHLTVDLNFEMSDKKEGAYLVFDIETTGLPTAGRDKIGNFNNWPKVIQLSWILFDSDGKKIKHLADYIKINEKIPPRVVAIHHITDEKLQADGSDAKEAFQNFLNDLDNCHTVIAHNIEFDAKVLEVDLIRHGFKPSITKKKMICTMLTGINHCKIYKSSTIGGGSYKAPKLDELYQHLFFPGQYGFSIQNQHDAIIDSAIAAKCFFEMDKISKSALNSDGSLNFMTVEFKNYFYATDSAKSPVAKPNIDNVENKENPFYKKKVVVSGVFQQFSREGIKEYLVGLGAEINTKISGKTDYVIYGENAGPAKLEQIDNLQDKGSSIKKITEDQFLEMLRK